MHHLSRQPPAPGLKKNETQFLKSNILRQYSIKIELSLTEEWHSENNYLFCVTKLWCFYKNSKFCSYSKSTAVPNYRFLIFLRYFMKHSLALHELMSCTAQNVCILSLETRLGIWLIWVCTNMRPLPWTLNTCTQKSQTVCAYNPSAVAQEWQHMRIPGTCWPSSVAETQFQVQWESTLSQRSKAERDRERQPLSTSDLSTQTCIHSFTH